MRPNSKAVSRRLLILKYIIIQSYFLPPKSLLDELRKNNSLNDFDKEIEIRTLETISLLKKHNLWRRVSKNEKAFLLSKWSNLDSTTQIDANWRMEAAGMLMWALNIMEEWPKIDEQLRPELLKKIDIKRISLFSKEWTLRPINEIKQKRDLIETWHWRINTRRLIESGFKFEPDENIKKFGFNSLDEIVRATANSAFNNGEIDNIINEDFTFNGKAIRDLNSDEFSEATSIIMERHYGLNWICGYSSWNNWDNTPTNT